MRRILPISILFFLTQLSCISDEIEHKLDQQSFTGLLATIKPWQSVRKEDYKDQDWDHLVAVARIMQKSTPCPSRLHSRTGKDYTWCQPMRDKMVKFRPNEDEGTVGIAKTDAQKTNDDEGSAKLIEALRNVQVEGPSLGGPFQGISTNAATEAVVREGQPIVPKLISALDHSSWTQTVWIVFCLKELKAREAKERILKLQREVDSGRFAYQGHDLTLQAIIQGYLRVIDSQPSATGHETEDH